MTKVVTLSSGIQIAVDAIDVNLPSNLITLFSRLRVASDETQISFRQDTPMRSLLLSEGEVSGSGTSSSFIQAEASTILSVGTAVGLRRLKSRVAGLYIAGNSLLCLFTFNFETLGQANLYKRAGYFDDNDGIFPQQLNGVVSWVKRSSVSGSVVETSVIQSDWNRDKFDGNSAGYNFDQTKVHIGWIALEWLGVGDVYCGFIKDTQPIVAHVFSHPKYIN